MLPLQVRVFYYSNRNKTSTNTIRLYSCRLHYDAGDLFVLSPRDRQWDWTLVRRAESTFIRPEQTIELSGEPGEKQRDTERNKEGLE